MMLSGIHGDVKSTGTTTLPPKLRSRHFCRLLSHFGKPRGDLQKGIHVNHTLFAGEALSAVQKAQLLR